MTEEAASDVPPTFDAVSDDPFTVLGLSPTATDDEIKAAYRKLVLKCVLLLLLLLLIVHV
jgi:DnaJ-domain-containing protein 1